MKSLEIKNLAEDGAYEILMHGIIGPMDGEDGFTAREVLGILDSIPDAKEILLRVNSLGGSVIQAHAVYNALARMKARITAEVVVAGSAMSYLVMAADETAIAENGLFFVHRAWGMCVGNCQEMRDEATTLEKMDGTIAGMYASRTNRRAETWLKYMDNETWFTAEEAVQARLADRIIPNKGPKQPKVNMAALNKLCRKQMPERIAAMLRTDDPGSLPTDTKVLSFMAYENTPPGDDEIVIHAPGGGAPPVPGTPAAEELLADVQAKAVPQVDVASKLAEYNARIAAIAEAAK